MQLSLVLPTPPQGMEKTLEARVFLAELLCVLSTNSIYYDASEELDHASGKRLTFQHLGHGPCL